MIETYIIEQFVAFAELKTFSRVAEKLNTSQPSISRSMQKLEDELGVSLFERQKNKIALNELGEIAAVYAKNVLNAHNNMIQAVRAEAQKKRTFSYGSIAPAPIWELTPIISQLFMGMTVSADLKETENALLRGLKDDSYNLIVLFRPIEEKDANGNALFYSTPFIQEKLSILLPKNHPLANRKSIYLSDLAGEKILIHTKIGFWYNVCKEKIPNATFLEQSELSALREIVNATKLPSFVTDISGKIMPFPKGKVAIPILDDEVNVQFYIVCKEKNKGAYTAIFNATREH